MFIEIIPPAFLLIYLIIASIQDIKTREVSDWLPYTLIPISFIISLLVSYLIHSFKPIISTTITFVIFWIISLLLYHFRQWGGGDAKMFMAIGASLPVYPKILLQYVSPNLNLPFPAIIFINLLIAGSFYGIIYFMIIAARNKIRIRVDKKMTILVTVLAIGISSLSLIAPRQTIPPLFMLALLVFLSPYINKLSKVVQQKCLVKVIPTNKLTEGDWINKSVYKNKKLLLSNKIPGITLEEIAMLKKNSIKTISVRYGIPFIPPFLLSILISLILGNLFIF